MKLAIIIPFSIGILLLFAACVCWLVYIVSDKKSAKAGASALLWIAIIPFVVCGSIYLGCFFNDLTPVFVTDERISYEVGSEEEKVQVFVVNVAREKGEEDMYTIELDIFGLSFLDNKRTIPASVYNEYIGEGNNTITVKRDYIKTYVADLWAFGWSFEQFYTYEVERLYLPWEERTDNGFTNEDVSVFIDALVVHGGSIRKSDLSIDFDCFTTGRGSSSGPTVISGKQ